MKQSERASIFRIVADLIKADAIIDTREIELLDSIREKYGIKKDDEILGTSYTMSDAIRTLSFMSERFRHEFVAILNNIAMSDNYCAREEALLLLSVRMCLSLATKEYCNVISIDTSSVFIEPNQILYVESDFDEFINKEINSSFREITTEIRLAGFDFVYLPKIAEHYRSISEADLIKMVEFLYPMVSDERIESVKNQLRGLTTSEFCKDQIACKLGVNEFASINPSLMIKIGNSFVNDKKIGNFLIVGLEKEVLSIVRKVFDLFSEHYKTVKLNNLKEDSGRFVFTGFYKQIFDLYLLRRGIKSSIVIDIYRDRIWFPEADVVLEKLHRREKALYALFVLESASGGINFVKPSTPSQYAKYKKRMDSIQTKYRLIYKEFGGDPQKAPDISISEIRLPMIALIKKQLKTLSDVLFHVDDYMIQRNMFGNYCINISPSLCCCAGSNSEDINRLSDSDTWQKIMAL